MTPRQIELVQQTFKQVVPVRLEVARLFYGRLFWLDPTLKRLFHGNLEEQGDKLTATLARVVGELHRVHTVLDAIKGLAIRHVEYGVEDRHYATVGSALLWTLGQGLGSAFTDEVKEAWTAAYGLLSGTMMEAARESRLAQSA
jgi:hemoglobin-like flavoprotein